MSDETNQCVWTPKGGYSEGTCGAIDTMASYEWRFCPYCGKPLVFQPRPTPQEDQPYE